MYNNIYSAGQKRNLHIVFLVLLGIFLMMGIWKYLNGVVAAGIIYVLFKGFYNKLTQKWRWKKWLAAILIILISLVIIVIPFLGLSLLIAQRVNEHIKKSDQYIHKLLEWQKQLGFNLSNKEILTQIGGKASQMVSTLFPSMLLSMLDLFIVIGLMFLVLYFMLVRQETFLQALHTYVPFKRKTRYKLAEDLNNVIKANVIGQTVVSFVQGVTVAIGFWIFGIPDAAFWGLIAFLMAFIPILGTPVVWVPAGIITIIQGDTAHGIGLLIYGAVVIINIDNLLRIVLAKKLGDIHPLITLVGVLIGLPFFGVLGLVIGPLMLSYFVLLMQAYKQDYQADDLDEAKSTS